MKRLNNGIFTQFRRSLQVDILIAFATLLIITVLVIISYTYRQNTTAVLQLSNDLIRQVTNNVIERTTNYLAPASLMAQTSAQIPNAANFSLVDDADLENYGKEVLNLYPQLSGFFIGNEQGDFLFTKRDVDGSIDTSLHLPLSRASSAPIAIRIARRKRKHAIRHYSPLRAVHTRI